MLGWLRQYINRSEETRGGLKKYRSRVMFGGGWSFNPNRPLAGSIWIFCSLRAHLLGQMAHVNIKPFGCPVLWSNKYPNIAGAIYLRGMTPSLVTTSNPTVVLIICLGLIWDLCKVIELICWLVLIIYFHYWKLLSVLTIYIILLVGLLYIDDIDIGLQNMSLYDGTFL